MAAVRPELAEFAAKMDAATTAVGDRIQRLIDKSTTITPEERAELQRVSDGLDAMGKDPADPTPPIPTA